MSDSQLVSYVRLSPNHSGARKHPITRITPHYVDGNCTVETLGEVFAPVSRQASSNYGIGSDGRVGMYVEECNRAWTSGSYDNDNRAVTIECANLADGSLTDACWNSLVELCADICRRNGISNCSYTGDTSGVLTMHKWFQSTDCPGPWLSEQFERLSREVNAKLRGGGSMPTQEVTGWAGSLDACRDPSDFMYCACRVYSCGYSQPNRKSISRATLLAGTAEADCSSMVSWALAEAGYIPENPWFWTAIEMDYLMDYGFTRLLGSARPQRNDVLWRSGHTGMYVGDGMQAEALRTERHDAGYDGSTPGDQDGGETVVRAYQADSWAYILRPPAHLAPAIPDTTTGGDEMIGLIHQTDAAGATHIYYWDGVGAPQHIGPDQLAGIDRFYRATHGGAAIPVCKDMPAGEFDALCRL